MESRRAVDAIGIDERQRGISERRRALDERFGQRGSLEEAECRSGVELDVHDSIDHALDKPRITIPLTKQAIAHAIVKRDIPLIPIPSAFAAARLRRDRSVFAAVRLRRDRSVFAAARLRRDRRLFPPGAGCPPGAGGGRHTSAAEAAAIDPYADRTAVLHTHAGGHGISESAERYYGSRGRSHFHDTPRH